MYTYAQVHNSVMCISVCMKYSIPQLTVSVYPNYYMAMLSLHKCMQHAAATSLPPVLGGPGGVGDPVLEASGNVA